MRIRLLPAAVTALMLGAGVLGTSTAAFADPPWARGGYGYHHGGPPPWAPAYGRRRHEGWGREGWGHDRPYRAMRFREERRSFGYRY